MFRLAAERAPGSDDVRVYLALHQSRGASWASAVPALEQALARTPDRVPVVEALARVRERQGRPADAAALWQRAFGLRGATAAEWLRLGDLAMSAAATDVAIGAFESARRSRPEGFPRDLELGVLYLAARRFEDARGALDRVPASHPAYPMALFKRAQVSVLLNEPDAAARIDAARRRADAATRELIARERLFAGR
jgi:tetratricopeptide (TPR) repeat protein